MMQGLVPCFSCKALKIVFCGKRFLKKPKKGHFITADLKTKPVLLPGSGFPLALNFPKEVQKTKLLTQRISSSYLHGNYNNLKLPNFRSCCFAIPEYAGSFGK